MSVARTIDWRLYVVTDDVLLQGRSHREVLEAAIAGGATVVQYRAKHASTRQMVAEAQALRDLTRRTGIPFIVNDRLDVALAVDADGVHVGQDDMPVALARRLIGDKLLGVSAHSLHQATKAVQDGADYLGVGPIFATATKPDAEPPIGLGELRRIRQHISIPIVAIGGINQANAADVMRAGVDGIAVVSAVVAADDVTAAARQLRALVSVTREKAL